MDSKINVIKVPVTTYEEQTQLTIVLNKREAEILYHLLGNIPLTHVWVFANLSLPPDLKSNKFSYEEIDRLFRSIINATKQIIK